MFHQRPGSVAVLTMAALMTATPSTAATLVASYLFDGTLASGVAGAPALALVDPTGASGFATEDVYGTSRTVFEVRGDAVNANQAGFVFDSTGLMTSDSWSVALTIKFFDKENAWRRIVDVTERLTDGGFYVNPSNQLAIYPVSGSAVAWENDVYWNVALTVGPSGPNNVSGYIDGIGSFSTTTDIMEIGADGLIHLFLDNVEGGGQREWSNVNIAAAKFYDGVLTPAEVAAINADPTAEPPVTPPASGAVPEPTTWALMIAGFALTGAGLRRRSAQIRFA